MQQDQGIVQHPPKRCPGGSFRLWFGLVVQSRFNGFQIPVAEFMPHKIVQRPGALVEAIAIQGVGHILRHLAQTGQLYLESAAMALGKVYCFGPTFRAEKSKTRRHLTEFWMIEPEMAFADLEDVMDVEEQFVSHMIARVLDEHGDELADVLERDLAPLERVQAPFPRISYDEAVERLQQGEFPDFPWGEDFGAPHETFLSSQFDRPVFVYHYPTEVKAFYMEEVPDRPEVSDTYGWLLVQSGKLQQGLGILREAAEAAPEHAEINYHYATALADAGRNDEAAARLEKLLAGSGDSPDRDRAARLLERLR